MSWRQGRYLGVPYWIDAEAWTAWRSWIIRTTTPEVLAAVNARPWAEQRVWWRALCSGWSALQSCTTLPFLAQWTDGERISDNRAAIVPQEPTDSPILSLSISIAPELAFLPSLRDVVDSTGESVYSDTRGGTGYAPPSASTQQTASIMIAGRAMRQRWRSRCGVAVPIEAGPVRWSQPPVEIPSSVREHRQWPAGTWPPQGCMSYGWDTTEVRTPGRWIGTIGAPDREWIPERVESGVSDGWVPVATEFRGVAILARALPEDGAAWADAQVRRILTLNSETIERLHAARTFRATPEMAALWRSELGDAASQLDRAARAYSDGLTRTLGQDPEVRRFFEDAAAIGGAVRQIGAAASGPVGEGYARGFQQVADWVRGIVSALPAAVAEYPLPQGIPGVYLAAEIDGRPAYMHCAIPRSMTSDSEAPPWQAAALPAEVLRDPGDGLFVVPVRRFTP